MPGPYELILVWFWCEADSNEAPWYDGVVFQNLVVYQRSFVVWAVCHAWFGSGQ